MKEIEEQWYPILGRLVAAGAEPYGFNPGVSCYLNGRSIRFGSMEIEFINSLLKKAYPELENDKIARDFFHKHNEEKK